MPPAADTAAPVAPAGGGTYDTPIGVGGAIDTKTGDILSGPMAGQKATQTPAPALITTSNASRANFATNTTNLNTALAGMTGKQTYNFVDSTGKMQQVQASSPEEAMHIAPNIGKTSGVQLVEPTNPAPAAPPAGGAPTDTGRNPDAGAGTKTPGSPNYDPNADPNFTGATTDSIVAGLPPGLQGYYKGILDSQQTDVTNATATLTSAASLLGNDPAAQAAIQQIQAQFQPLIQAMQAKNAQVLGRASTEMAAFGGLGVMPESFMSNEMGLAVNRVADLYTKMQNAILKSNAAYQSQDVKAFNAAQTAVEKAKSDLSGTLSKLLTATNEHTKEVQAQAKIDAANAKTAFTEGITAATKAAPGMVDALNKAGITDEATISDYIKKMATQLGVDPDVLAGQVAAARQTAAKTAASTAASLHSANRPYSTSKGGSKAKFNVSDGIAAVGPQMQAEVKSSGSTDGYIDPNKWVAARANWQALGGTAASFNSNFKQYLNPASYAKAGFKTAGGKKS